jgi:hypothetical protein
VALDGDGFAWLPGFSYHLGLVSRAAGNDGTAREWGYAAAIRYERSWSETQRTLLFAEGIQFRNAGGRPLGEVTTLGLDPDSGEEAETVTDTPDPGAPHLHHARPRPPGRPLARHAGLAARPAEAERESLPDRELCRGLGRAGARRGFGLDVGYQYGRYAREEAGGLGTSHSLLVRLGWRN